MPSLEEDTKVPLLVDEESEAEALKKRSMTTFQISSDEKNTGCDNHDGRTGKTPPFGTFCNFAVNNNCCRRLSLLGLILMLMMMALLVIAIPDSAEGMTNSLVANKIIHKAKIYFKRPTHLLFFRPRYGTPGYGRYRVSGHYVDWGSYTMTTYDQDNQTYHDDDRYFMNPSPHAVTLTWYRGCCNGGMVYQIGASEPSPAFLGPNATIALPWRPSTDDDTYTITVNATIRQYSAEDESLEDDALPCADQQMTRIFFEDYGFSEETADQHPREGASENFIDNFSFWILECGKSMVAEECVALAQDSLVIADDDVPTYDRATGRIQ